MYYLRRSTPFIGDKIDRRCFLTSLLVHLGSLLLILVWPAIAAWFMRSKPEVVAEPTRTQILFIEEEPPRPAPALPPLPDMPQSSPLSTPGGSEALRPRLNIQGREGAGPGSLGDVGQDIQSPRLPDPLALALGTSESRQGGGDPPSSARQRREQEANYFLMGFLLRKYREDWKPVFGQNLARGSIYLWIEQDNSRIISARFAQGSSTGIPELDRLIRQWLVEENHIDLSDLRDSERQLLMSVDLYEAHR